jgi:hypothetical protein
MLDTGHLYDACELAADDTLAPLLDRLVERFDLDPDGALSGAVALALGEALIAGTRLGAVEVLARCVEAGVNVGPVQFLRVHPDDAH